MKVVILAGGAGRRLLEETEVKPKPMVAIGERPILWHIMKHYAHYGFTRFAIALGYKGEVIRQYMSKENEIDAGPGADGTDNNDRLQGGAPPDWEVELVDTGMTTQTGGRIKRLAPHLGNAAFMLTWGDAVSDVDILKLLEFHRSHGKLATLTAVNPPARFGQVELDGDRVAAFSEKPQLSDQWINGAYFVLEPGVMDYIDGDDTQWEREPLERLARDGQLMAFRHRSFWQCMDTLYDRRYLEDIWRSGRAPWKIWE
ncbi:MAG: glucose-1-phosphate cytidylyltransferase [Deltaproteobacteria bacterium]|nr:glucose-1-phosphate cytidylyltransferase [Deltaproteobacteria bacterium]MBW2283835.1 glucose-1-phosphate cytidylyltransferase [Deltaproteobacteria bacterium]